MTYDKIVAATGICENKSSLAAILANPIYRGVRVFNRALRSAGPRASERINVEIEAVAAELEAAQAKIAELDQAERPLRITTKLVRPTIDDMNGILDHAPLATRVEWVRDLFERIDVDSRDEKAVAVWRAATDEGVNRSDSVYEWIRR